MARMNSIDAPPISILLAAAFIAAGCTTMSAQDCRSADWYALGYRDGDVYGLRPQIDQYAYQCRAAGVPAHETVYLSGWVDGYREWTSRTQGGEIP